MAVLFDEPCSVNFRPFRSNEMGHVYVYVRFDGGIKIWIVVKKDRASFHCVIYLFSFLGHAWGSNCVASKGLGGGLYCFDNEVEHE